MSSSAFIRTVCPCECWFYGRKVILSVVWSIIHLAVNWLHVDFHTPSIAHTVLFFWVNEDLFMIIFCLAICSTKISFYNLNLTFIIAQLTKSSRNAFCNVLYVCINLKWYMRARSIYCLYFSIVTRDSVFLIFQSIINKPPKVYNVQNSVFVFFWRTSSVWKLLLLGEYNRWRWREKPIRTRHGLCVPHSPGARFRGLGGAKMGMKIIKLNYYILDSDAHYFA